MNPSWIRVSRTRARMLAASAMAMAMAIGGAFSASHADAATATASLANASASSPASGVKTADLSKFQAGNIVSDAVFLDRAAMSEWEIQAFLESNVPRCQSGYTCLKDYYDTARTISADAMCGAYLGGSRERASRIIYKVAQACGINPQVILVMLQKEQGLVTTTAPSSWNYQAAMGQGCPDTAECDARYYGLFNQVFWGAWQMKRYANPPGTSQYFTWYAPGRTWNIRWHPNEACGSSPVYIQNQATANLYYYTPYQPNAAALRAGYGTGDSCSSYGNRNFYQYFTDWFGSTQIPATVPALASLSTDRHVVALDGAGNLWAYPHSASGRWGSRVQIGNGFAGVRHLLPVGDLDGDGARDLIAAFSDGRVVLYRGNGALGYAGATTLSVQWTDAVMATAAGDFDGDGEPDVFTVRPSGELLLWSGDAGLLRAPRTVGAGWAGMNLVAGGVDLDKDGSPDLIGRDKGGNLYVYPGDGVGGWKERRLIGTGWNGMSTVFSPGDFTGDDVADVLARDGSGRLWRYTGSATGMLGSSAQVGVGWESMSVLTSSGPLPVGKRALAPGVGDLSGDRFPDVLAQSGTGDVVAYMGDGRGGWKSWRTVLSGWSTADRLIPLGDFDRDGNRDIARVLEDGTFFLFRGNGKGFAAGGSVIGAGWAQLDALIGAIDFDGDRNTDVLARTKTGDLLLYRGDGRGGWLGGPSTVGLGWGGFTALLYAGDFDGDHVGDVVARASDGALWLYPTNGAGGWKSPRVIGVGWSDMTAITAPGDFDGTGGADLLSRSGGDLILYRGDGAGGWLGTRTIGVGWASMVGIV